MMIQTLIVDDEHNGRYALASLLARHCPDVHLAAEADSVKSAVEAIRQFRPALVFLDVEMPGGSGFEVLEALEPIDFRVIFVTAFEHYAIRAIRYAAFDYLLKPVLVDDLRAAVQRYRDGVELQDNTTEQLQKLRNHLQSEALEKLALPTTEGFSFVKVEDIIRCTAQSNYTRFFLRGGVEAFVPKTLGEFEELLEGSNFIRIHNSHLVNLNYVDRYMKGRGGYVVMQDGSEVEVSVRRKDRFLEHFRRL